jgi:hypothetical protein
LNCDFVHQVELTSSIRLIEELAFSGTSIKSIVIPSTVTTIGDSAFATCRLLEEVTFEPVSQFKRIHNRTFQDCGLTQISIPASIESLGCHAFAFCAKLTKIKFEGGSRLKWIEDQCFAFSGLTSLRLPSSVDHLSRLAFACCSADLISERFEISQNCVIDKRDWHLIGFREFGFCKGGQIEMFQGRCLLNSVVNEICIPRSVQTLGQSCFQSFGLNETRRGPGPEMQ